MGSNFEAAKDAKNAKKKIARVSLRRSCGVHSETSTPSVFLPRASLEARPSELEAGGFLKSHAKFAKSAKFLGGKCPHGSP